uniref:CS domain-containing protein n=1 Tax=Alexandrium catenella TaxID=2925 RepID=A0A7S1RXB7_ALECA|mmetsp:Transcript_76496/g.203148  ORF Transcript_76496/g.203148 Transcript_76496/m.203148 type:complete len:889 (+) Transcript_76496:58-2724(+)
MAAKQSVGEAHLEAAELCLERGEPEDALGPAKEALEFFRKAKDEEKTREALKAACSALVAGKDYEDGIKMASEELELAKKAGNKKAQGEMLVILADLYLLMDKPKLATESATEAIEIFDADGVKDSKGLAKAMRAAIYAYLARGKQKMALKLAKQALGVAQSSDDREGEASSWNQLGVAKMQSNKTDEVPQALSEAVAIYKEVQDKARQAATMSSLAQFHLAKGNPQEALKLSEQARALFGECGKTGGAIEAWDITVAAYMQLGKSETVLRKAKVDLTAAKKAGNGEKIAVCEQRLLRTNLKMADEEGAMHAAKRACARMSETGDWKGQAAMLRVAAFLHLRSDRVELALRAAQEALAILKAHKGKEEHAREQAALQTVIAQAHGKRGEEPPMTAPRAAALNAIEELGKALEEKKVDAFEKALRRLQCAGAYTPNDTKAKIETIVGKDKTAAKFVTKHLPMSELMEQEPEGVKMNVTCLRKFECETAGGVADGVEWSQTMGKVVLRYPLEEGTKEDDVKVQLSGFSVQVTIAGKKLPALTGSFTNNINLKRTWWEPEVEAVKRRGRGIDANSKKLTLVISMAKAEHKAWHKLWFEGEMKHPAAKGRYAWTQEMMRQNQSEAEEKGILRDVAPGKPEEEILPLESDPALETGLFPAQSNKFKFAPDEVVVGVDTTQDARTITIRIVFDGEALRVVQQTVAMEDLLAADIWEDRVSIFLRGDDQNPILAGQLWSTCVPHLSSWKMGSDDSFRQRQADFNASAPVLKITIVKSDDAQSRWNKIFKSCWQHRLMIKNCDELEAMLVALQEDAANNTLSYEDRDQLTKQLAEWREERFPGLADAQRLTRRGNDSQDSDFYVNLQNTVEEITKRTGTVGKARWNDELGRYSYVY